MSFAQTFELTFRYHPIWIYIEQSAIFLYLLLLSLVAATNFVAPTPRASSIPVFAFKAIGTWGFMTLTSAVFGPLKSSAIRAIIGIHAIYFVRVFKPKWRRFCHVATVLMVIYFAYSVTSVIAAQEPRTRSITLDRVPEKLCQGRPPPKRPFSEVFAEYAAMHRNITSTMPGDAWRMLQFHANEDGLGNRLEGLLFVVDWPASIKCNAHLDALFDAPGFDWVTMPKETNSSTMLFFYCRNCLFRGSDDRWGSLMCDKEFGEVNMEHRQIFHIHSTQWFAAALVRNPHYRDKVCELIGEDVFGPVARELLRPAKPVRDLIDSVKSEHFAHSEVVSMQMRRLEGNRLNWDQEDIFLRCAAQISDSATSKFFLATDDDSARVRMRKIAGDRLVEVPGAKFSRDTTEGIKIALAEMFLLGEANKMIMSPYSTYGGVAHARKSLVPWIVGRDSQCRRALTSQPCFFYWFGLLKRYCWKDDMYTSEMTNMEDCNL